MYPSQHLYINGQFLDGDGRKTQGIFNPADDKSIGQLPHASTADLDNALEAAQKAFESWRWTSPLERSALLRRVGALIRERCEDIARALTMDQGKPLAEARAEIMSCTSIWGRTSSRARPRRAMEFGRGSPARSAISGVRS